MTDVVEETQEQVETPAATENGGETPATETKAAKSWAERIKTSVKNGATNGRYQWFKEFFENAQQEAAGEDEDIVPIDINTMAIVMTLVNPLRQTPEYKEWDAEYRATTGGGGATKTAEPKTPEEIREFAKRAEEQAARQAKAKANADARAERARLLLAQLEQEESGDDESDADAPDEAEETQEDEAF